MQFTVVYSLKSATGRIRSEIGLYPQNAQKPQFARTRGQFWSKQELQNEIGALDQAALYAARRELSIELLYDKIRLHLDQLWHVLNSEEIRALGPKIWSFWPKIDNFWTKIDFFQFFEIYSGLYISRDYSNTNF